MKHGDFRALLEGERQRFVAYARSLLAGSVDLDAEDAVHDVVVKVLERTDAAPLDNLLAYVYRSLRNRVIDHVRTRRSTVSLDLWNEAAAAGIGEVIGAEPGGFEALQTEEGRTRLFEALQTLGEMERRVVIAHEFEGTPFKDLSRQWDVPLNTLLSHKSRALKKLKRHFLDH